MTSPPEWMAAICCMRFLASFAVAISKSFLACEEKTFLVFRDKRTTPAISFKRWMLTYPFGFFYNFFTLFAFLGLLFSLCVSMLAYKCCRETDPCNSSPVHHGFWVHWKRSRKKFKINPNQTSGTGVTVESNCLGMTLKQSEVQVWRGKQVLRPLAAWNDRWKN